MDSEIEAVEQEQRPKDPMRHFIPLEVPSFRGEQVTTQRSVVVSLRGIAYSSLVKQQKTTHSAQK